MKKLMIALIAACVCTALFAHEEEESEIIVVNYEEARNPKSLELCVTDNAKLPVEGVEITVYDFVRGVYKEIATLKTDEKGVVNIPYQDEQRLLKIEVAKSGYKSQKISFKYLGRFSLPLEKE